MGRRKTQDPEPSLFPFLSVLAAVMGTLVLIIAGMSKIALANPKQRVEVEAWDPARKKAVYVECDGEGLRVHGDEPGRRAPVRISGVGIAASAEWLEVLRALEHDPSRYLMFLVRAEGVSAFQEARSTVSGTAVDFGYEPVFGTGELTFQARRPQR